MNQKSGVPSILIFISWIVFVANVCFCLYPFVANGSISFDKYVLYGMKYELYMISSLVSVSIMCFSVELKNTSIFGTVCSWIWSFICCLGIASIRYTQMGFNSLSATRTWKFFGTLLVIFILTLVSSSKIGAAVRTAKVSQSNSKQKLRAFDIFFLLLLIGRTAFGIVLILNLEKYYSLALNYYTFFTIGVLAIPVAFFIIFAISWRGNQIVGSWFCAAIAVMFECAALRLKIVGSNNQILHWVLLATVAVGISIYMNSKIKNIVSSITSISIIAAYLIMLMIESPMWTNVSRVTGDETNWWIVGPIIFDVVSAYTFSLVLFLQRTIQENNVE
jgi:membrane protein